MSNVIQFRHSAASQGGSGSRQLTTMEPDNESRHYLISDHETAAGVPQKAPAVTWSEPFLWFALLCAFVAGFGVVGGFQ